MAPPAPNPLAASADKTTHNTLSEGMVRLPIGWVAVDPQPNARTYFWLVLPTKTGGKLTVVHEGGGTLQLVAHDGVEVLMKGGSKLIYEVPVGRYGTHYVIAEGGSERRVSCQFEQISYARTSASDSAPRFAPWNFFYWPSADPYLLPKTVQAADGTRTIQLDEVHNSDLPLEIAALRKYARAFGKNPDFAEQWERTYHGMKRGPVWMGHCHLAAAASILFEEPVAQTIKYHTLATNAPAQEDFSVEEIKYLVSEWVGNFGNPERVWPPDGTRFPYKDHRDLFYYMLFKPADKKGLTSLAFTIRSYFPEQPDAVAEARRVMGLTPSFEASVNQWFGEAAASFYQALIDQIRVDKQALVADLRSAYAAAGPAEVWNHAIFYYKASYVETTQPHDAGGSGHDAGDPLDMWITCDICANADILVRDPRTNEPMSSGTPSPGGASPSRTSFQHWRIVFDGQGNILVKDNRNEWMRCALSESGEELYAPAFLLKMKTPAAIPNTAEKPLQLGNVEVGSELLVAKPPLAALRQRYRANK